MRKENRCSATSAILVAILAILILTYFAKSVNANQFDDSLQPQGDLFYSSVILPFTRVFN